MSGIDPEAVIVGLAFGQTLKRLREIKGLPLETKAVSSRVSRRRFSFLFLDSPIVSKTCIS